MEGNSLVRYETGCVQGSPLSTGLGELCTVYLEPMSQPMFQTLEGQLGHAVRCRWVDDIFYAMAVRNTKLNPDAIDELFANVEKHVVGICTAGKLEMKIESETFGFLSGKQVAPHVGWPKTEATQKAETPKEAVDSCHCQGSEEARRALPTPGGFSGSSVEHPETYAGHLWLVRSHSLCFQPLMEKSFQSGLSAKPEADHVATVVSELAAVCDKSSSGAIRDSLVDSCKKLWRSYFRRHFVEKALRKISLKHPYLQNVFASALAGFDAASVESTRASSTTTGPRTTKTSSATRSPCSLRTSPVPLQTPQFPLRPFCEEHVEGRFRDQDPQAQAQLPQRPGVEARVGGHVWEKGAVDLIDRNLQQRPRPPQPQRGTNERRVQQTAAAREALRRNRGKRRATTTPTTTTTTTTTASTATGAKNNEIELNPNQ